MLEALAHLDLHNWHLGIGGVHAHHSPRPHRRALIACVVKDPLGSSLHLAQVHDGGRVGDAIPFRLLIAQEVVEGVDVGFGLEQEVGHALHGMRDEAAREA